MAQNKVLYVGMAKAVRIVPQSCLKCRYSLTIEYNNRLSNNNQQDIFMEELVVILMNPSKADMTQSDDTINNVILHMSRYCNRLIILNLSPVRGSDPATLEETELEIFDKSNQAFIKRFLDQKTKNLEKDTNLHILLAYGGNKTKGFCRRRTRLLKLLLPHEQQIKLYSYGNLNKDSTPIHFSPRNSNRLGNRIIAPRIIVKNHLGNPTLQ